jgi:hypothetical protein
MRKFDKIKNIKKANLLSEQRIYHQTVFLMILNKKQ